MKQYPVISFVIPTYNSASTIDLTLSSIRKQTYPQNRLEILVVDGGSSDDTIKRARKYSCKIIRNSKTDIVNAEFLGYSKAKGRYLIGIAPDEVLENKNSLKIKYSAVSVFPNVKAVLSTGYKTPENFAEINNYINEFGDPFSYFIYRESKGYRFLVQDLKRHNTPVFQNTDFTVFSFVGSKQLPLIELWAGASMIDLKFAKRNFPEINKNPSLIPLLFYLINQKKGCLSVTKNDATVHYSTGSFRKYLKKIRSRVEFNIYKTAMGKGGYTGREKFHSTNIKIKKYLFLVYSLTLVFPIIDALYLTATRRKAIFLTHPVLCFYTAFTILYFYFIKTLNLRHTIKLYGH